MSYTLTMDISRFLNVFGYWDWTIIALSALLFFAAGPFSRWLNPDSGLTARISMMRFLNLLIIVVVIVNALFLFDGDLLSGLTQSLIVIYFAALSTQVINFFIRARFGKSRVSNNKRVVSDTYSSRGLSLIVGVVVSVVAIVSCLRILGLDSLLEAGGAIGILGLILAMTQGAWAPDIISGLIILNSRLCEEGDVIQFQMDGEQVIASVFKTKLFHTECLDMVNNHRLMLRNAKLRDAGIQNLSRFASAKGLRERLLFNIDYQHDQAEVTSMILRAFEEIDKGEKMREEQFEPEVMVFNTGDHAVTWAVYYYTKDIKRLLRIRQVFHGYVLAEAQRSGISLATPFLHQADVKIPSQGV